jgi:hypothetical protein
MGDIEPHPVKPHKSVCQPKRMIQMDKFSTNGINLNNHI